MSAERGAVGGYLPWEITTGGGHYHPDALRYQSARHALEALLHAARPKRIWLPWFSCDVLDQAAKRAGVDVGYYDLTPELVPRTDFRMTAGEVLLYVNYFGLADDAASEVCRRFDPESVILDCAQAFFYRARTDVLATVHSARKTFGVPSGGFLATHIKVVPPEREEPIDASDLSHLLQRRTLGAEAGFDAFRRAEMRFEDQPPYRMSFVTDALLRGIDYAAVRARRAANFSRYAARLSGIAAPMAGIRPASPLSFPVRGGAQLRMMLRARRIYTPVYWPLSSEAAAACPVGRMIADQWVHLPVDQNLEPKDIDLVIDAVLEAAP